MDVSKGEFAKMANLSPGRVSQLIADGRLADCLVGDGRKARIDAPKAMEKLKLRLDPAQRLGNGSETRLEASDKVDEALRHEKLKAARADNLRREEEALARRGIYVRAEHVATEGGKLAADILQGFEGALTDVASEIAATYQLPQRDVVHLMRKRFREARVKIAAKLNAQALVLPAFVEDVNKD